MHHGNRAFDIGRQLSMLRSASENMGRSVDLANLEALRRSRLQAIEIREHLYTLNLRRDELRSNLGEMLAIGPLHLYRQGLKQRCLRLKRELEHLRTEADRLRTNMTA